jgi:hypothetical protein
MHKVLLKDEMQEPADEMHNARGNHAKKNRNDAFPELKVEV